jgi:hypothetical protein
MVTSSALKASFLLTYTILAKVEIGLIVFVELGEFLSASNAHLWRHRLERLGSH